MPTLSDDEIIRALYEGVLGREPDPGGLQNYRARLKQGAKLGELIEEFIRSEEFRKKAGTLTGSGSNGVQVDYQAVARNDHRRSGWQTFETAELYTGVSIRPDDTVVDVGCGDGGKLSFCAHFAKKVIGIDIDPERVEKTESKLRLLGKAEFSVIQSDGNPLPLESEIVDRIICTEVLEHVDDPAIVLREMARIGKRGALYVMTVPDSIHEHARKKVAPPSAFMKPNHVRIIERDEFARMVEQVGLRIKGHFFHGFYQAVLTTLHWKCRLDPETKRHPVLDYWAKTWDEVLKLPEGKICKEALDTAMPKAQIVIAEKL